MITIQMGDRRIRMPQAETFTMTEESIELWAANGDIFLGSLTLRGDVEIDVEIPFTPPTFQDTRFAPNGTVWDASHVRLDEGHDGRDLMHQGNHQAPDVDVTQYQPAVGGVEDPTVPSPTKRKK